MSAHLDLTDGNGHTTRIPLSAPVPTPDHQGISLGGDTRSGVLLSGMSPEWLADMRVALREVERQQAVNAAVPVKEPSGLCRGQDDPDTRRMLEGLGETLRDKYGEAP